MDRIWDRENGARAGLEADEAYQEMPVRIPTRGRGRSGGGVVPVALRPRGTSSAAATLGNGGFGEGVLV